MIYTGRRSSKHNRELLAHFYRVVSEYVARAAGDLRRLRNDLALAVRHFTHPSDYRLGREFMRRAAAACGDVVELDGTWAPCRGELWLADALACPDEVRP